MTAPQTAATSAANAADIRCIAAFSLAIGSVPAEARSGVAGGMMFFYGRILGRSPGLDLEAALRKTLGATANKEEFRPDLTRCGAEMQKHGQYFTDMGKRLQETPPKPAK
jgi:hypothetical protein